MVRRPYRLAYSFMALLFGLGCAPSDVPPEPDASDDLADGTLNDTGNPTDMGIDVTPDVAADAADAADAVTPMDSQSDVTCPAGQAYCGGMCVDFATDVNNCGACGQPCFVENGVPGCTSGACIVQSCTTGFADCNGIARDGCEVNLGTSVGNCGACARPCAPANATAVCTGGMCGIAGCTAGYGDCNAMASDGCETNLNTTLASCGTCGTACNPDHATPACTGGHCGIASCDTGYGDCNTTASDGCETNLNTNTSCGACGHACALGTRCAGGTCASSCPAGTTFCPDILICVNVRTDVTNCGTCGTACPAVPNGAATCSAGVCGLACNTGYADCDGMAANGCETNLNTTVTACGACGNACSLTNATPACTGGMCTVGTCNTGYADCNHSPADGCETDLDTTVTACGACGTACSLSNATAACTGGHCAVASCNAGYADCDGTAANGCETPTNTNANCGACGTMCAAGTRCAGSSCVSSCPAGTTYCAASGVCASLPTDPANCGMCGTICPALSNASATCSMGSCGFACNAGYADCDTNPANGCEANLTSGVNNCGGCGNVCDLANATPSCTSGRCTIATCSSGYSDCNGNPADGCETNLDTTVTSCGSCGNACNLPNATASCSAGTCSIAGCNPGYGNCDGTAANGCETAINTNANCGACGMACAAGARCSGSVCVSSCPPDTTYCTASGTCANTLTDPANCGGCGMLCVLPPNASATCSAGRCGFACNAGFADCDGMAGNGCEVNLNTSAANCGACGTTCGLPNAMAACSGGTCAVGSCNTGYGDCDGMTANGCETNLNTTVTSCGACGAACNLANATASCSTGRCVVAGCNTGYGDCDGTAADGCETPTNTNSNCGTCGMTCSGGTHCSGSTCVSSCPTGTTYCAASGICANLQSDLNNCGACGTACPTPANSTPSCSTGTCAYACNTGYADCNMSASDGCEVNLNTSAANCGTCGHTCSLANATAACSGGGCVIAGCNAGYGDCDGTDSNGCETNLNTTATACGSCGNVCNLANATASCMTGTCVVATCNAGYGNCNGNSTDGCETQLNSNSNCGMCGRTCATGTLCSGGTCVTSCPTGTTYCASSGTCVNLQGDVNNCGSCGNACPAVSNATATCTSGTCGFVCNAGFGNCDGMAVNGCETNVTTSTANCGACGNVCTFAHATPTCSGGACAIGGCNAGYGNCNGILADGCETDLNATTNNCGTCGTRCAFTNATAACTGGACGIASCNAGYGNCDGTRSNGCETTLNTNANCGTCGTRCTGGSSCAGSTCVSMCPTGRTYCAGSGTCVNLQTDPDHCGLCFITCPTRTNATRTCTSGMCGYACVAGYGNCDGSNTNGCETSLYTTTNCGACGNTCTPPNATGACGTGTCGIASCNRGYGDCNGLVPDGCETNLTNTNAHCGSCGTACATGRNCRNGICQ